MSLDVIIRRNISFLCCILIVAVTELNKILRLLFIVLQWRRRCISSSISFNSHLVHIRWFIGVIGLLYRPLSIFRSCELIRYLAIDVMRWFPLVCKIYGSTQKYIFINAYVRSLLELSISSLHCCVNILTIDSLNEIINLFVSTIFCDSQIWSSSARWRTERIREHNLWSQCHLAQEAYCRHFWLDGSEIVLEFYTNILRLLCVVGW